MNIPDDWAVESGYDDSLTFGISYKLIGEPTTRWTAVYVEWEDAIARGLEAMLDHGEAVEWIVVVAFTPTLSEHGRVELQEVI